MLAASTEHLLVALRAVRMVDSMAVYSVLRKAAWRAVPMAVQSVELSED